MGQVGSYLYRHIRLDTNQVFYVGIGTNNKHSNLTYRRSKDTKGRSEHWHRVAAKAGYSIDIVIDGLTRLQAEEKEKEFILLYGRICNGGTLVNQTDGGEGTSGRQFSESAKKRIGVASAARSFSEEHRRKISKANVGRPSGNLGKKMSEDAKKILSQQRKGIPKSEEHRMNIGKAHLGLKRSDEARENMRKAHATRGPISKETRLKQSLSHKNRPPMTEQERINRCASQKLSWERRRAAKYMENAG